ncbi:MAG: CvpA family protein [Chitinophagaceae bacterium]|nr:CvpA family protein [Chitinophagaceae bacterium]
MIIDVIAAILLILAAFKGVRKGFILGLFSFLAFVIGLSAAIKLSAVVAEQLGHSTNVSQRWLPVLAFAIVFLVVTILVKLGARLIERVVRFAMLSWLNRLAGIFLYGLIYFFIYSIFLFYAEQLHLLKPETIQASGTYSLIRPLAPIIIDALGAILPFLKNMFTSLRHFW